MIATDARPVNDEQRAVLDHRESLCLSAGAGSGKTRTLVEKYLQLLIDEGRDPHEILAITFTEKAAAEMQVRIRRAILEIIQTETDPRRCGELEEKLMNLGGGWISTIHSFGARILREHPAEAGIDPAFSPLPEQDSRILWESAALAAILEMAARDPAVGELSLRLGLGMGGRGSSLVSLMMTLKSQFEAQGRRPEDIDPGPPARHSLDPAGLIGSLQELVHLPEPGAALSNKIPAWRILIDELSREGLKADRILRLLSRAGWDETNDRLKPGGSLKKNEKEIFGTVEIASRTLAGRAAECCEQELGATLGRLLTAMWRIAEQEKQRRRALDFSDLECKTLDLLDQNPAVAGAYRERFTHILVDEYQDVNLVQARIVRILAGDRPRALFAVGDPKQSIYRFRGADVEQFQSLWREMESRQAAFQLKSNYRSHPRLVQAVNAFFDGRIFCGRPPVEMVAAKPPGDSADRPRIQWLSFELGDALSTQRREREARLLTDHIRHLVESPGCSPAPNLTYGDIALLFRATGSLYLYEEAMRRAQIPYELVKSGTAFRSQEVLDLLNALTVAVDPSDLIAWLGFLRSPLAGLSDDGIWALARDRDLRDFFIGRADMPDGLSTEDRAAAEWARTLWQDSSRIRKIQTPLDLLDHILRASGYTAILCGLPQPDTRLRYVETLRALASQYGGHRPDPHAAFIESAWRMVDRNERESGSDAPASNRVKLMTIHQAKGLEFPVVMLPDLLRADPAAAPDLFVEESGFAARVKLAGVLEKFPTPRWRDAKDRAAASEAEEQKRLLYVSMTRAQELLVLPGPSDESAGRGRTIWEMLYKFLIEEPGHVEVITLTPPGGDATPEPPVSLASQLRGVQIEESAPAPISAGVQIATASSFVKADPARKEKRAGRPAPAKTRPPAASYSATLGTLAHQALQHADLRTTADEQAGRMIQFLDDRLRWLDVPETLADKLKNDLARFFRSPLADRLRRDPSRVRREFPFTYRLGPSEPDRFVRGKVDLFMFGEAGVEIYDYKYEEAGRDFGAYEGQMMAYALAACLAFDLPHVTVGLQFLTGAQPLQTRTVGKDDAEKFLLTS